MFFQRSVQSWKQPFFACYLTGKDPGNQCDQRQNTWWMNPTAPLSITVGDGMCFFFCVFSPFADCIFPKSFPCTLMRVVCLCLLDFPFSFFFAGHVIPQRELAARQLWFGHENKYAYRIRQLVWFRHRALATTPWRVSLQYVSSTSSANELRTCKCRRRSAGTELKT